MARTNFGIPSTGLPGNLYGGGAVVFNSQPYVNYYLQQQAHKQAQEDSMYKFFGDLSKNLSPAGMDSQDIPGLMQRKNQWQTFDMQNRKAIARPGVDQGKAYTESMSRYNEMMDYIARSKDKVKKLASLAPVLHSPQKTALLNDATQLRIHHGSLPLDHPDYQEFDPTSINYNPPPFDAKQANAMRLNLTMYKPSDTPQTIQLPNHQEQTIHNYKFNSNDLNGIYTQGVTNYHNNPSFQGEIDKVKDSPEMHTHLNELFKEHYGRDMYSSEDAAAAYMLSLHPDISNKVEQPRNIPYSPWESAAASLGREEQYYQYREGQKGQKEAEIDNEAEKFLQGRELEGKKKGSFPYTHKETGQKEAAYDIGFTPDQVQKIFSRRDISGKHIKTPDKIQVLESGDYLPIYYQRDENTGKVLEGPSGIAVDGRYTHPVSREAVKASLISHKIVGKPQTVPAPKPAEVKIKLSKGAFDDLK